MLRPEQVLLHNSEANSGERAKSNQRPFDAASVPPSVPVPRTERVDGDTPRQAGAVVQVLLDDLRCERDLNGTLSELEIPHWQTLITDTF